jgi:hypothetical protein
MFQYSHIHAKHASKERERQKDESDPAQPEQTKVYFEGLLCISDAD